MSKTDILIIAKEKETIAQIKKFLDGTVYNIKAIAEDPKEIKNYLESKSFDLIIIDYSFNENEDNINNSFMSLIEKYPIVYIYESDDIYSFHTKKNNYLIKPFTKSILITVLESAILKYKYHEILLKKDLIYRGLLENINIPIIIVDPHGQLIDINEKAKQLLFLKENQLRNYYIDTFFADINCYIGLKEKLHDNNCITDFKTKLKADNKEISVILSAFSIKDKHKNSICTQFLINEEKEKKDTSNVNYDIILDTALNNYSEISVNASIISDIKDHLNQIKTLSEKASKLSNHTFILNETSSKDIKYVNINSFLQEIQDVYTILLGETFGIIYDLSFDIKEIKIDRKTLEQILFNLILNAKEAMPDGGDITISTKALSIDKDMQLQNPEFNMGEYIMISVEDEGKGIKQDIQGKIFEPFFSTKDQSNSPTLSSGLGLSIVKNLIKQNNGFINFESKEGIGSKFSIYFPAFLSEKGDKKPKISHVFKNIFKDKTALIIDDDKDALLFCKDILEYTGINVLEAKNSIHGIDLSKDYKEKIHLIICEIILKNLSGKLTASNIKKQHPEASVIFTSNYPKIILCKFGIFQEDNAFINKPYSDIELINIINTALKTIN